MNKANKQAEEQVKSAQNNLKKARRDLKLVKDLTSKLPDVAKERLLNIHVFAHKADVWLTMAGDAAQLCAVVAALPPLPLSYGTAGCTVVGPREEVEKQYKKTIPALPLIIKFGRKGRYGLFKDGGYDRTLFEVEWWTKLGKKTVQVTFCLPYVLCHIRGNHDYYGHIVDAVIERYRWICEDPLEDSRVIDFAGGEKGQGQYWNKTMWWPEDSGKSVDTILAMIIGRAARVHAYEFAE